MVSIVNPLATYPYTIPSRTERAAGELRDYLNDIGLPVWVVQMLLLMKVMVAEVFGVAVEGEDECAHLIVDAPPTDTKLPESMYELSEVYFLDSDETWDWSRRDKLRAYSVRRRVGKVLTVVTTRASLRWVPWGRREAVVELALPSEPQHPSQAILKLQNETAQAIRPERRITDILGHALCLARSQRCLGEPRPSSPASDDAPQDEVCTHTDPERAGRC